LRIKVDLVYFDLQAIFCLSFHHSISSVNFDFVIIAFTLLPLVSIQKLTVCVIHQACSACRVTSRV